MADSEQSPESTKMSEKEITDRTEAIAGFIHLWTKSIEDCHSVPEFFPKLSRRYERMSLSSYGPPDSYDNPPNKNKIRWIQAIEEGLSVFITGKAGAGKTHLAIGLLRRRFCQRMRVEFEEYPAPDSRDNIQYARFSGWQPKFIFLPAVEFFFELKQSWDKDNSITESELVEKYSEAEFLLLDDLGSEKVSEWSRQMFYLLLDRRHRNQLQTIITSNLSLDEISEKIDDRISSRICEMGIIIELSGEDRRVG